MLCNKCGYSNLEDSRYCAICGNELSQEPRGGNIDAGSVPCPSCGFLNEEIATFCRSCGKKMKQSRKKRAPKNAEKPSNKGDKPSAENGSIEKEELAVLLGLDKPGVNPETGDEAAQSEELSKQQEDSGTPDKTETEKDEAETADAEKPDEPKSQPATDGVISDPDEMARLIASIKQDEEPAGDTEQAKDEAEPETGQSGGEAPAPADEKSDEPKPQPDTGGVISDPDEMAKLIASIKQDEEPAGDTEQTEDETEETVSTPHDNVEANISDEEDNDQDSDEEDSNEAESAKISAMAEITTTLNSLIGNLLEVEIFELDQPDSLQVSESDFPSSDPQSYKKKKETASAAPATREVFEYLVTAATFLLSGMSIGLWVWYLLN